MWTRATVLGAVMTSAIALVMSGSNVKSLPVGPLDSRATLAAALGPVRPLQGRLVGLEFAPYRMGAAIDPSPHALRVMRETEKRCGRSLTGDSLGECALISLVTGRLEAAERLLQRGLRRLPDDPRLLSDLAAIKLAKSQRDGSSEDLLESVVAAGRARRLDPRLPEAAFNHALALEELRLQELAEAAWSSYLAVEEEPDWQAVAGAHLASLETEDKRQQWSRQRQELLAAGRDRDKEAVQRIVEEFPQFAREYAEQGLLATWANARTPAEARTARWLAEAIGAALLQLGDDHLLTDAVKAIAAAEEVASVLQLRLLQIGHRAFVQGVDLYEAARSTDARPFFETAQDAFVAVASPLAGWAQFYLSLCAYQNQDFDAALSMLMELDRDLHSKAYPILRGRVGWVIGLIHYETGSPDRSLQYYWRALLAFKRTKEVGNVGAVHSLIANSLDRLGQHDRAWRHRREALQALPQIKAPARWQNLLGQAAVAARNQGHPEAGLYFLNEAVRRVEMSKEPRVCAIARLQRAEVYAQLGRINSARLDLQQSRSWARAIEGESERKAVEEDLTAAEATVLEPRAALASLEETARRYEETDYSFRLPSIYQRLAGYRLALGQTVAAERDLRRAIDLSNSQVRYLRSLRERLIHNESRQSLYDDLILLLVRRGEAERAFLVAEEARAAFFGQRDGNSREKLSVALGVQFVEYALVGDTLICWIFAQERLSVSSTIVSRTFLDGAVSALLTALRDGTPRAKVESLATLLGDVLWRPVAQRITKGPVVIIPDKVLWHLPFAALMGPAKRFVVEDHILSYAPSAGSLVVAPSRTRSQRMMGVVSDPTFDRQIFPKLPRLEGSIEEGEALVASDTAAVFLHGPHATKVAFLELLRSRDIVIFNGHSVVNRADPLLSYLVLAPSRGEAGVLYAYELMDLRGNLPSLVLLVSCDSGIGSGTARSLVGGLGWSLIRAGVDSVMASFWRIGDRGTLRQVKAFYGRFTDGSQGAEALQSAQLDLLERWRTAEGFPADWAAFGWMSAEATDGSFN